MTDTDALSGGPGRLVTLTVADDPATWASAGFTVAGDRVRLGDTVLHLAGRAAGHGLVGWELSGVPLDGDRLDGLPTAIVPAPEFTDAAQAHPNGLTTIDHVVVLTADLQRTIDAFAAVGLEVRRIRETSSYGSPMRQAFIRLGPILIEIVSGDAGVGLTADEAPAAFFGLAANADDLDVTKAAMGPNLGDIKDAVQDGRRIATFKYKDLGLSVAIAVMDDHAGR